jgi:hypothetical protein
MAKKSNWQVCIHVENLTKKEAGRLYETLLPIIASSPGTIVWDDE